MAEKPVDPIDTRYFRALKWANPADALRELPATIESEGRAARPSSRSDRLLRTTYQALVFAYGLGKEVLRDKVMVAITESRDHDFVIVWQSDDRDNFFPVQLKELTDSEVNPTDNIENILTKLQKYRGKDDLSVAIYLNRPLRLFGDPSELLERLDIRELWLFGPKVGAPDRWFLCGSMLHDEPQYYEFDCPTSGAYVA